MIPDWNHVNFLPTRFMLKFMLCIVVTFDAQRFVDYTLKYLPLIEQIEGRPNGESEWEIENNHKGSIEFLRSGIIFQLRICLASKG